MFDALVDDMEIEDFQQPQNNSTRQRGVNNNVVNRYTENKPHISGITAGRIGGSLANSNTQLMGGLPTVGVNSGSQSKGNHSNDKKNLNLKLAKKEVTGVNSDFVNTGQDDFASLPAKRQKVTTPDNEVIDGFEDDVDFSEINEYEQMDIGIVEQNINVRSGNFTVFGSNAVSHNASESSKNTSNHKQLIGSLSKPKRETLKAVKSEPTVSSLKNYSVKIQSEKDRKARADGGIDRFFSPSKTASADMMVSGAVSGKPFYPFTPSGLFHAL